MQTKHSYISTLTPNPNLNGCLAPEKAWRRHPGAAVPDGLKLLHWQLGPLRKQQVLLPAKPFSS